MNYRKIIITLLLLAMGYTSVFSQAKTHKILRKSHIAPEEIVSMSKSMPFDQALEILNILSKKFLNKILVDPQELKKPIGVDIQQMHWLDALEKILLFNNMWYSEHDDYIKITQSEQQAAAEPAEKDSDREYDFNTREVIISAIFFEADGSQLQQMGFSWDVFRAKDVNVQANMTAASNKTGSFEVSVAPNLDFGNFLAIFKALENNQVGEVVASPQITVRSLQEGRIQVGSDISVVIKDFAGNSVTQFFSTGSIISVTPEVLLHDSTYYIHLDLNIERSNSTQATTGLEIKKSVATTSVLLLDGEETIIGGLYVNEESSTREGIPILKNLPWWFFGIRYLCGFESKKMIKKELIILLSAELLPSLAERVESQKSNYKNRPTLLERRLKIWEKLKFYKDQAQPLE